MTNPLHRGDFCLVYTVLRARPRYRPDYVPARWVIADPAKVAGGVWRLRKEVRG